MGDSVQNVVFDSNGAQAHGYLALPPGGSGPGVLVIQEWWGLTSHIASVVDRLAAAGFVALAPDLYGGATTHDAAEAIEMMKSLPEERASRDLAGAVDFLLAREEVVSDTVGVIGFCMGGRFVLEMAVQQGPRISAAVPFYGLPGADFDPSGMVCAVQGHFGARDPSIPVDAAQSLFARIGEVATKPVEVHVYEAGHAFLNDENLLGTYDPEKAALAWGRALDFLGEHVSRAGGH